MGQKSPILRFQISQSRVIENKVFHSIFKNLLFDICSENMIFLFSLLKGHHGDQGASGPVGPAGPRVGVPRDTYLRDRAYGRREPRTLLPYETFSGSHSPSSLGPCWS